MSEELQMLRRENERLLSYIHACRSRFGDAAVNAAIMEQCPPPEMKPRSPGMSSLLLTELARARASKKANTEAREPGPTT